MGGTKSQIAKAGAVAFLQGAAVAATIYGVIWGAALVSIAGASGVTIAAAQRIQQYSEGGKVYIVKLEQNLPASRWWGGKAGEIGPWWTTEVFGSSAEAISRLALRPEWGNTAARMSTGVIPAGTTVIMSYAARAGPLLGGGIQVYLADPNVVNLVR
jgi:hypothetical protein